MNAIIGDNGIITRAQEANIQSSIASLEEFLQLKYTENYEQMAQYQSKIEGLTNVCSSYFYIPTLEGVGGLRYVTDIDGHALYLIKKSGLPEEIRESLIGGDAGKGSYADYSTLNDVYGVTSNLNVYYCSGGTDSIKGLAKENLDNDNLLREVFSNSNSSTKELYNLVSDYDKDGNGIVTAEEVKSIKNLTVDENSNISDFKNFYNFVSLQELIISSKNLESLDGIQNCAQLSFVYFQNSKIENYSALKGLSNTLTHLYFYNINDAELEKVCDTTIGIGGQDFSKLMYLAFSGTKDRICSLVLNSGEFGVDNYDRSSKNSSLTSIEPLENLTDITCEAVQYLSLQNNAINSLTVLRRFENVTLLRAEMNELTSLDGLENMKSLYYLYVQKNKLGEQEQILGDSDHDGFDEGVNDNNSLKALNNLENLISLQLSDNTSLKFLHYISKNIRIQTLTLDNITGLNGDSLILVKNIINNCVNLKISSKYGLLLLDENTKQLGLQSQTLERNQFELLKNNKNILDLNLSGLIITGTGGEKIEGDNLNIIINEVLETLISLENISLENVKISNIKFVEKIKNLQRIDLRGTNLTTNLKTVDGEDVGLELLENCVNLKRFIFDGVADCSKLQNCINRCNEMGDYYGIFNWGYSLGGFSISNITSLTSLENCTDVKTLSMGMNYKILEKNVDLSGLENLKEVYIRSLAKSTFKLILPENITRLVNSNGSVPDLSNCKKISYLNFGAAYLQDGEFSYCNFSSTAEDITIEISWTTMNGNVLGFLNGLNVGSLYLIGGSVATFDTNVLNINLPKLHELRVQNYSNSNGALGPISNFTSLTNLTMTNVSISDISGLENLENLTYLNLSGNSISNLQSLRNLKKLQTLNLSNNLIYDRTTVVDGENQNITINNLEILGDLNPLAGKGGVLEKLYLSGNTGIIDFSPVSKYTNWVEKSGF